MFPLLCSPPLEKRTPSLLWKFAHWIFDPSLPTCRLGLDYRKCPLSQSVSLKNNQKEELFSTGGDKHEGSLLHSQWPHLIFFHFSNFLPPGHHLVATRISKRTTVNLFPWQQILDNRLLTLLCNKLCDLILIFLPSIFMNPKLEGLDPWTCCRFPSICACPFPKENCTWQCQKIAALPNTRPFSSWVSFSH